MAIDTGVQVFTDAELLKLTRKAIADILAGGQAYGIGGRSLTRADLKALWETVAILEDKVADASLDNGDTVLGSFGGPV